MKTCLFLCFAFCSLSVFSAEPTVWGGIWTFENTLDDLSGFGDHGYIGLPAVFTPGEKGQALKMLYHVTIPDAPSLRLAPGFHLACRVRLDAFSGGNSSIDLVMKDGYKPGGYFLRVNPASEGRHFAFFANVGSYEPRVNSREAARLGVWYDLEAGWDGKSIWLSVNGDTTRVDRAGTSCANYEPVDLRPFEGAMDELKIASPNGCRSGLANWSFDNTLRDDSGHGHDFTSKDSAFEPVTGGFALRTGKEEFSTPSTSDLQLSSGLRLNCSVFFKTVPKDYTTLLIKNNEYMLRVDSPVEGSRLSFFVKLDGKWDPRVSTSWSVESNKWYHLSAYWDGCKLFLKVNGERFECNHMGHPSPGKDALVVSRFDGLLDNLQIENPNPFTLWISQLVTDTLLFREGQSTRYSGRIRNYGKALSACTVTLEVPTGVVCESSAAIDLGPISPYGERPMEWRLRAEAPVNGTARISVRKPDGQNFTVSRPLVVLPATDPDYSAHAWNPPAPTNRAAAYHIDSIRGDNARDGLSPETAWRDFTPVNGRALAPGERLLIRRGSVINQELKISARGTAQAWAEIGAYGEGARPILRRNRDIDDRCALITDPNYLRIRGLTFCHAAKGLTVTYTDAGFRGLIIEDCIAHHIEGIYRPNAHGIPEWRDRFGAKGDDGRSGGIVIGNPLGKDIVVRDCEVFQCSSGFCVSGRNVFVDRIFCHDNYAHNTSPHPYLISVKTAYLQNSVFDASGWHASSGTMGIMLGFPYGLIIRDCNFLNQPESGSGDEGGIDFEAGGQWCRIDRCTFRNNAGAAIEFLGLKSPQTPDTEITRCRFDRNNYMHMLGPSEIFIWGKSIDPRVCCSSGFIHDNGYVLAPGVSFFTNQVPDMTDWKLSNNTEYASSKALAKAMPCNEPPAVDAGPEIWTDSLTARLKGKADDDGKPVKREFTTAWEVLDGPGTVSFRDRTEPRTKADFSAVGDYTLRLKADDGKLWRSARTVVHILPPGTSVAKAWGFSVPLDKEGWSDWDLGTKKEDFLAQPWPTTAHPVHIVAGGEYIMAIKDAPDARLLSPCPLDVDIGKNTLVAIRFQNHTPAGRMRLRFTTASAPLWEEGLGKVFAVTPNDNESRLYEVGLHGTKGWEGRLRQLRLDFADGSPLTGTCRVDYIWIGRRK